MKNLVILGAGTAGTMMLNKLKHILDEDDWRLTIVDNHKSHYYQPGFLFIPFGIYNAKDVTRKKTDFFPPGIDAVFAEVTKVSPAENKVHLDSGETLNYDILIIATGAKITPDETEGLKGELWQKSVFDFYTIEGAKALAKFFRHWEGGKLVVNITEMPIKCPVAPLEFLFLADEYFIKRGIRDKVELTFSTPLSGAFTKPIASGILGDLLDKKNIKLVPDFSIESVNNEKKTINSYDEQEISFDVLVSIPTNMGSSYVEESGLGDELKFVETDKHTLQSKKHENIFVIGDATNVPASKAGSVAHFQADILIENILDYIDGRKLTAKFDGHANSLPETGSYAKKLVRGLAPAF